MADRDRRVATERELLLVDPTDDERLARIRLVGSALNGAVSVNQALDIVLVQAAAVLGGAGGVIALVQPDETLHTVAHAGLHDEQVERFATIALHAAVPIARAARTGAAVWLADREERDERFPEMARVARASVASASLPLRVNGSVIGVLGVGCEHPFEFSAEDKLFLGALAEICASFLARVGYVPLYRSSPTLPAAGQLLDALFSRASIGVAYIDRDLRLVMANDAFLEIGGITTSRHIGASVAELAPWLAEEDASILSSVLETGEAVTGLEHSGETAARAGEVRHWIIDVFPVRLADATIVGLGLTVVDVTERSRLLALLRAAEQREVEDRFRLALDSMLDLVAIESAVRDETGAIVDFTIDYLNPVLGDVAGRGRDQLVGRRLLELYPAMTTSPLWDAFCEVATTGEPRILPELEYADVIDGTAVKASYSIQVVAFGDGVLVVARDITEALTAQAALRAATRRITEEHQTIEMLQQIIVPRLPVVSGANLRGAYLPAESSQVGGDWYDAFELPDGQIGLVVGDVAGHGLEAAAMMTQTRNAIRAYAELDPDPSLTLERANRLLVGDEEINFVTCFYGVFEPASRRLHWSTAGHPPPLVTRGNNEAVYLDAVLGPPIGVVSGATYDTAVTQLRHGEDLVLYTDGLIERPSEPIDQGLERLRHLVLALDSDRPDFLATLAHALTGGSARRDDICILSLTIS